MRLVTFELSTPLGAVRRTGALVQEQVVDLCFARGSLLQSLGRPRYRALAEAEVPSDMLQLLEGGEYAQDCAREALAHVARSGADEVDGAVISHPRPAVKLLSPLPRPNSLRDFLVVEEHLRNAYRTLGREDSFPPEWFNLPAHYKGNVDAIYGPDEMVPYPGFTDKLDYELEVCAVVGRRGYRVKAEAADAYIAGYTLYNDWSARDIQMRESSVGIGPGIGKDFASSLGPCIATADEFDVAGARLQARVDGETWSDGSLANMHFSFPEIIEYISQEAPIVPGDLLGSGTIGNGCGLESGRYLEPGMVVELEGEGIGILRNRLSEKGPRSEIGAPKPG